jgi:hypothetical protein
MTPEQLTQLGTTFGPIGALVLYILNQWIRSKSEQKPDTLQDDVKKILDTINSLDRRLAVVETILEERKK